MIYRFLFLLCTTTFFGQYTIDLEKDNVNNSKKARENDQLKRETKGKCNYYPVHEYKVGMKFYFPIDEYKLKYATNYDKYYAISTVEKAEIKKISYRDVSGKVFSIVKIENRNSKISLDTYLTFKQVDSLFFIEHKLVMTFEELDKQWKKEDILDQAYVLPDVIYADEIDEFRKLFLNKEFYTTFLLDGVQFKKVKIVNVGAGFSEGPIRLIVANDKGVKEQIDVCNCGTNVFSNYYKANSVWNFLLEENPKNTFSGNDENWELICQKKIKIGFTEKEVILSLGEPEQINEFNGKKGITKLYSYPSVEVLMENGKVLSFNYYNN